MAEGRAAQVGAGQIHLAQVGARGDPPPGGWPPPRIRRGTTRRRAGLRPPGSVRGPDRGTGWSCGSDLGSWRSLSLGSTCGGCLWGDWVPYGEPSGRDAQPAPRTHWGMVHPRPPGNLGREGAPQDHSGLVEPAPWSERRPSHVRPRMHLSQLGPLSLTVAARFQAQTLDGAGPAAPPRRTRADGLAETGHGRRLKRNGTMSVQPFPTELVE